MKMKKRLILISLQIILLGTISVNRNSLFAYTFEELKNAMISNNPEILKLEQEYVKSNLDYKDAVAGFFPTIDLQVSGTYMVNPPVDALYLNVDEILNSISWPSGIKPQTGNQYVKVFDGMENTLYQFQLTMTQPIFTWGKITNATRLYKQISQIKQTQFFSKQEELQIELESRLTALFYIEKILQILEEEKEYTERLVQVCEDAKKSGMLLEQDVLEAKIQAKQIDIAQQDLTEQMNQQLLELERSTGIPDLTVQNIEFDYDEESLLENLKNDRTELEERALSSEKLSIKMLTQLKEVNQTAEKIAKASVNWKPDFALQVSAGYGGSRFPLVEPNWLRKDDYSTNISIGLKTTVWDGGKKVRDVSRKISETTTAEIQKLDACATIKKTLSEQFNAADVCTMKIEYQELKIQTSLSKISQAETVFKTGYGSETDVLNAKIECCNEKIEKEKQALNRATSCLKIKYLCQ